MAPDEFEKIFGDKPCDNTGNLNSNDLDDSLLTNLAFKIPRQKVDALRRSLLNIVPHYFNNHIGKFTFLNFSFIIHDATSGCGSWCVHR